jgi:hypothetical protein
MARSLVGALSAGGAFSAFGERTSPRGTAPSCARAGGGGFSGSCAAAREGAKSNTPASRPAAATPDLIVSSAIALKQRFCHSWRRSKISKIWQF